jgi:hypothetical protein
MSGLNPAVLLHKVTNNTDNKYETSLLLLQGITPLRNDDQWKSSARQFAATGYSHYPTFRIPA